MAAKKILIVGKYGQLSEALQITGKALRYEIFAFDRKEMDVTSWPAVREKLDDVKPDILINTAVNQILQNCEENPIGAMEINFLAVRNLAETCKKRGIIFITFSSDYIFDGEKGSSYEENDRPNPLQVFGLSKLAGEYAALSIYPEKSYIVRTSALYGGSEGSPEKGNFVLNIIKESSEKKALEVSSEQVVSPTYAGDLSEAIFELISKKAEPGIYHLVNEGQCSWYEFTKEIFRLGGIKTKLSPIDRGGVSAKGGAAVGRVKRPKFSILKNIKAEALGITLPSWQSGLNSYFDFLNHVEKK